MCDRHNKDLDNFCLEHEMRICSKCATEEHCQMPCESMPLAMAMQQISSKIDTATVDLRHMQGVSQSILDGKRQEYSLRTISEAETKFDEYVDEIKRKFAKARKSVRPFAELSREELWKLKAVVTKRLPNIPQKRDGDDDLQQAIELVDRLGEIRKQEKVAREVLQALPNYVEVAIDPNFLGSLKYDGSPVHISRNGEEDGIVADVNDSMSVSLNTDQGTIYLIEKSQFSLEHCVDMILMEEYFIASVGDSIHKRDLKHMAFRQGISVPGADKLSVIGETTEVAVLQRIHFISVLETAPNLTILYRLMFDKHYVDCSYLESVLGDRGCPTQSPVFIVCHNVHDYFPIDYVDLIQPRPTKYPGKPPKYHVDVRNLVDSSSGRNKSRFRGATKVSALHGKYILVGASKAISCLNKSGVLTWTIDMYQQISHILTFKGLIYVCVENEKRILTVGKRGHVIQENILPVSDYTPERLNAFNDTLLVKVVGQAKWVFYKQMQEM